MNNEHFKLSITGIDGAGKDSVAKESLALVSEAADVRIIKLGRPAYEISNGSSEQVFTLLTEKIDALHGYCDQLGKPELIMAVNALNVVAQTRFMERAANNGPYDIIASSRDPRVDPAVYLDFYGKQLASVIDDRTRIAAMNQLSGISRDLIILLKVDPKTALERIDARIASEMSQSDVMRKKWRHIHENYTDLSALDDAYERVIAHARVEDACTVARVDTNQMDKDEVAHAVADIIHREYTIWHEQCA